MLRTPTRAEGGITEKEKKQMDIITQKYIANAYKTGDTDKEKLIEAIKGIYKVAELKEPRVVIVPSPLVMALSYGLSAGVWYIKKNATYAATNAATRNATNAATRNATDAATRDATYTATDAATRDATIAATIAATNATTRNATNAATRVATNTATNAATDTATNAATYDATYAATIAATNTTTRVATKKATISATISATDAATIYATDAATIAATDTATDAATISATISATIAATRDATYDATYDATRDATDAATRDATYAATDAATIAATRNATYAATRNATNTATISATDTATIAATNAATDTAWLRDLAVVYGGDKYQILLDFITKWNTCYQGGNMWSGSLAYVDACKNVLGLTGLNCWDKFEPYRQAGMLGGFRVMHEEFCIVTEFPLEIHVNSKNQAHNENGVSHRWKDGFSIYSLNGVQVPDWLVLTPAEKLTMEQYHTIKNADVRTEFVRKYGVERMIDKGKVIDTYQAYNNEWWTKSEYKLIDMAAIFDNIDYAPHLWMLNQTVKGIYHLEPVSPKCRTLKEAIDEREQIDSSKYQTIDIK